MVVPAFIAAETHEVGVQTERRRRYHMDVNCNTFTRTPLSEAGNPSTMCLSRLQTAKSSPGSPWILSLKVEKLYENSCTTSFVNS
jgi:hypothetical protein